MIVIILNHDAETKFKNVSKISSDSVEININSFKKLHNAIKVRVLRKGIKAILGDTNFIDQKHIDDVIELENESKINKMLTLPRGIFVYRRKNSIILNYNRNSRRRYRVFL